jgi:hypothetical protein
MSDRTTMMRETDEVLAELRGVLDRLSEEQAPVSYWGLRFP